MGTHTPRQSRRLRADTWGARHTRPYAPSHASPDISDSAASEARFPPTGLSEAEARRRLDIYGYNEIAPEHRVPLVMQFLQHLWGPIPWMIEAAGLLALLLQAWASFLVILGNLLLNASVAFYEEYQAGSAVAALRKKLAPQARAHRDGEWKSLPARELVPGDVIHVRMGDIVPADASLLASGQIELDRSTLTGESLPVQCDPDDTIHAGCTVMHGEADALVTATGARVAFSRTVELVQATHTTGHLGHLVIRLNNFLIAGALLLSVVNTGVSLLRGRALAPVLEFTLLLLVAAIPASMPTVLSVMLAAGAQRIARKRALTTRIEAIEELACMDYLCADKTGTLTKNALAAGKPWCLNGIPANQVMRDAALASSTFDRDAIDTAIYAAVPLEAKRDDYTVLAFQPFDPLLKRTEALVADQSGGHFRVTKGAVQVILELAEADSGLRERVKAIVSDFARHGSRALAVARAREGGPWQVEGVISLYDPVRDDSASAVETVRSQGIRMLLLTGDQLPIGVEIARRVGLGTTILVPDTAGAGGTPALPLTTALAEVDGFAQVLPEHKFQIVEALQRERHVVGMVGDGVNDAPALRKADVGIAVSGAGDAVRSASDLVLLTSGLMVIADAITTSRQVYQRMHTYVVYRVSETMRRMLSMVLASLIFFVYPLTPIMLGLLATLNAGVLVALAYDRVDTPKNPTRWRISALLTVAIALGLLGIFEFFGLLYISAVLLQLPHVASQTVLYLGLSLAGHLTIFVTRTRGPFWSLAPAPILLGSVVIAEVVATVFAIFGIFMAPISWELAAVVWCWSVAWFFVEDRVKLGAYALVDRFGQQRRDHQRAMPER